MLLAFCDAYLILDYINQKNWCLGTRGADKKPTSTERSAHGNHRSTWIYSTTSKNSAISDVIFCYSFLLHILFSCSFRPCLFAGCIHSCHRALRTKNQIFLNFYINKDQTQDEICRKPASADFFSKNLKKSLQSNLFCRLFSSFSWFFTFFAVFTPVKFHFM